MPVGRFDGDSLFHKLSGLAFLGNSFAFRRVIEMAVVPENSIRAEMGVSSGELAYARAANSGECLRNEGFLARESPDLRIKGGREVTGLLIWKAFRKAAALNTRARWSIAMRKARTIHAEQMKRRKQKKVKAGVNGTVVTEGTGTGEPRRAATQAEARFALDD